MSKTGLAGPRLSGGCGEGPPCCSQHPGAPGVAGLWPQSPVCSPCSLGFFLCLRVLLSLIRTLSSDAGPTVVRRDLTTTLWAVITSAEALFPGSHPEALVDMPLGTAVPARTEHLGRPAESLSRPPPASVGQLRSEAGVCVQPQLCSAVG